MNRIDVLIEILERLQIFSATNQYSNGMFPSQRFHRILPYVREDNNIFFPASIAFILLKNFKYFDKKQSDIVQKIIDGIRMNYPLYADQSDGLTYNFYQTIPHKHFPYGFFLSRFHHFALAEDADDTVMISMTLNEFSSEKINKVRKKLAHYSNLSQKKITDIDNRYSELPFYATWLGTGKMPIELEICILCNILYFTFSYQLELNAQDKASLDLIKMAIDNDDIMTNSHQISGQYPKFSVILFHITRLCSVINNPELYFDIDKLTATIRTQLKTVSIFERIILSISLMYLGEAIEPIAWELHSQKLRKEFKSFPFFVAPMLSGTSNKILNRLKKYKFFQIQYRSEAFYYTLLLEYELLMKSTSAVTNQIEPGPGSK
jgi:hypothetical protein